VKASDRPYMGALVTVRSERNWALAYDRPPHEASAWGVWELRPGDLALVVCLRATPHRNTFSLILFDGRLGWTWTSWLIVA